MEPEASIPKFGQEHALTQYGGQIERTSQVHVPEQGPEVGGDRREQVAENSSVASENSGMATQLAVPTVIDDAIQDASSVTSVATTAPAVANDDDLIEKEWVDRAKKIVADTRSDPYSQEKAVSALQKDYLKKRYGRELGGAE